MPKEIKEFKKNNEKTANKCTSKVTIQTIELAIWRL